MRGFVHVPEILSEQTISFPDAIRAGLELLEVCFAALENSV